jgi:hypothetical protein
MKRGIRSILLGLTVGLVALGSTMGINYTRNVLEQPIATVQEVKPLTSERWLQTVCDDEEVASQSEVAEVVIRAQEEAEVGELVRLDLTGTMVGRTLCSALVKPVPICLLWRVLTKAQLM